MNKLIEKLKELSEMLGDHENEALVLASDCDVQTLNSVARCLIDASQALFNCAESLKAQEKEAGLTPNDLQRLANIADEYDSSGDAELIRTADVLDTILMTIGAKPEDVLRAKAMDEEALKSIREKMKKEEVDRYKSTQAVHERIIQSEEAKKLIADRVKHYRPQQHALQTRSCPDHAGNQMVRVADGTWQCSLDGKVYNFQQGYTKLTGDKVPGGSVDQQSQTMHNLNENTAFDSRITRLNQ
jgi:hypothetical protein